MRVCSLDPCGSPPSHVLRFRSVATNTQLHTLDVRGVRLDHSAVLLALVQALQQQENSKSKQMAHSSAFQPAQGRPQHDLDVNSINRTRSPEGKTGQGLVVLKVESGQLATVNHGNEEGKSDRQRVRTIFRLMKQRQQEEMQRLEVGPQSPSLYL